MDTFIADSALPPSLADKPFLAMLTIMALWAGTLFCLQWLYSTVADMRDEPAPRRHPLTAFRWMKILLVIAALTCTSPRMVLVMCWNYLSPEWRENLSLGSWLFLMIWAVLIGAAWWIDKVSGPYTDYQLRRVPSPRVFAETVKAEKTRGVITLGLIFVIAFATTYVRPMPDVPPALQRAGH